MIIFLLFLSISCIAINAFHFNGGTITWAPVDPYDNSSSVGITITQTYSWSYPTITCTTNVPISSGYSNANLVCIANCSTDGGYSHAPINILTDCTSYSSLLGVMSSQRSVNTTLTLGAYFYIAYTGSSWRDLYNPTVTGLSWSIVTLIDLRLRSDGIIDTPPVANVVSPQYVTVNTTTLINIPVSDVNEGDDIRCRWAINNVNLSIDECSGICYPYGLPNNTILSNCTLSFTGPIASTWYAIAIQIEDFINKTSTEPMSSVPVQFLIYVQPTPICTILPLILPLTDCLEVEVGVTMNFTLYAMNLCNSTVTITGIIISKGISGMTTGNLINSTTNISLSSILLTWTPKANQIGSQELCTIAYNNLFVQSVQYCVTFTVTTSTPNCSITTSTPNFSITTSTPNFSITTSTPSCPITTSSTTAVLTTETSNKDENSINIPLIVGLSLLGLMLALCCFCCWLYHLLGGVAARRRRKEQGKESIRQQKYPQLLPLIITRNLPFKTLNNSSLVHKISNDRNNTYTPCLSTSTPLSYMPKNQISIAATENIDQSLAKCSKPSHHQNNDITKFPRNKPLIVYNTAKFSDSQKKDRSNTVTTTLSVNEDIIIEDSNISIHQDEPMNVIKLNEGETPTTVRRTRIIKVKAPVSEKRRSRSNNTNISSRSITGEHSSRMDSVSVTRVRRLPDNTQLKTNHEKSVFPEDNGKHTDNKITVISVPRQKSKTRSHISRR